MERPRIIDLGKTVVTIGLLGVASLNSAKPVLAGLYADRSSSLKAHHFPLSETPHQLLSENYPRENELPSIKQGDIDPITLPNGQIIYPQSALDLSFWSQIDQFETSPWNHLGFKYLSFENTNQYNLIQDKGPVLWLSLHSSDRRNLPGNTFLNEQIFYNNPFMYIGDQKLQVEGIRSDLYVKDFIDNDEQYNNYILSVADTMEGNVFFQVCKPPYFHDSFGNYVGEYLEVVSAKKVP